MKKSRMMSLVLVGMFAVSSVFAGNVTVQAETGGQSKMLSNRVHSLQNINQSKVLPETKRTLSADKSYTDEELCIIVRPLELGSMPPVDSDLCVVVPDDGGELALRCARSSADAGIPCRVIVGTSLEVHDLGPDGANDLAGYIVASDPQAALTEFADWVIRACPNTGLALAANFSFLRPAKISEIIGRYSKENALIGAISLIPGADLPIMTVNQFRMAFEIAAACGVQLRIKRIADLVSILGAGFAYRSLARSLVGAIPVVGWAIRGSVGYLGTQTTGHALALRYHRSVGANRRP